MDDDATPLDRALIVVTGKGGVGKTTVTAALALAAARRGRRTIALEIAGQRRVPALLGHPAAGPPGTEDEVAPGLWASTADPERALAEWAGRIVRPRALVELEGDDLQDPIGDTARSILDGHVVLSRRLATSGHFPAVDVLESISRVTSAVTTREQQQAARRMRRLLAAHRDVRELVEIGAYVNGANNDADLALELMPQIEAFLQQDMDDPTDTATTWQRLNGLVNS